MRPWLVLLAAFAGFLPDTAGNATAPPLASSSISRSFLIHERLNSANQWRDHVMVVAHRAGWKVNGVPVRAENSFAAIDHAAASGIEMVELDIRRSKDGVLVIMHDATLDRTTNCQGRVADWTLTALRRCSLVIEGSRQVTEERVATLSEAMLHARGRVLINIDNKLEPEALIEIAALARSLDMADGVLLKLAVWNAERLALAETITRAIGPDIAFMPILADDAVRDPAFIEEVKLTIQPPAAELVHWYRDASAPITTDGGPLLSPRAQAVAIRNDAHLWINTYPITDRPEGMVAGGRGDYLALSTGRPEDVYGFFIERGVTIIQTDEPDALIAWLENQGLRRPYALTQ